MPPMEGGVMSQIQTDRRQSRESYIQESYFNRRCEFHIACLYYSTEVTKNGTKKLVRCIEPAL